MPNDTPLAVIARRVRAEMAAQRRTQGELAAALGISTQMVARRMAGDVEFSALELAGTASLLQVSIDTLLGTAVAVEEAAS